jgi:hypothetical protein
MTELLTSDNFPLKLMESRDTFSLSPLPGMDGCIGRQFGSVEGVDHQFLILVPFVKQLMYLIRKWHEVMNRCFR